MLNNQKLGRDRNKLKIIKVSLSWILFVTLLVLASSNIIAWGLESGNFDSSLTVVDGGGIADASSTNYNSDIAVAQPITGSTASGLFSTILGFFFSMSASMNQPPSITGVDITPSNPKINNDLTCTVAGWSDVDGDSEQYYFDWYNETVYYSHTLQESNIHVLGLSNTSRWETWKCTVTPNDGDSNGTALSDEVMINNTLPTDVTVVLSASSAYNRTTDNLSVVISGSSDINLDSIRNITDWRKEGVSMAVLNMPFNTNDSGVAKDYSTYSNNGTVSGATWTSEGKIGGGYSFDGTNYIECTSQIFKENNPWTVTSWIKLNNLNSDYQGAVSVGGASTNRAMWLGVMSSNTLGAGLWGDNTATTITPIIGKWYHIGVSYSGGISGDLKIYVDGNYESSDVVNPDITNNVPLIGMIVNSYYFNGSIDEVKIYNYSLSSEQININYFAGFNNRSVQTVHSNETGQGDTWQVAVTPNDGYGDGNTTTSNSIQIEGNTAPSKVILVSPANTEDTSINRTPILNWSAASDSESDLLTYELNLTRVTFTGEPSCSVNSISESGISILNYTTSELCVDDWYEWKVRAYDGYDYGVWSDIWNFSVQSYISVNLLQDAIDFGSLLQGETSNTSDDSVNALKIGNLGNVYVNLTIHGTESLWIRDYAFLNTSYFQFKANVSEELNSFDSGSSQMDWLNVTDYPINLLNLLNYNATRNSALIDVLVMVPSTETAGIKESTLNITASWG